MSRFAQNYPQLMNQATEAGYCDNDLELLQQAFEVALRMSNGIYRTQGVPLINHLVSSASILISEDQELDLVVAALLHAVYVIHRFENATMSHDLVQRKQELQSRFGMEVEELLCAYEATPWYKAEVLKGYLSRLPELNKNVIRILKLRLANELDDHLDGAMHYTRLERTRMRSRENREYCRALAAELHLNGVAQEFEKVIGTRITPIPALQWDKNQGYEMTDRLWRMTVFERVKHKTRQVLKRAKRFASPRTGKTN